MSLSCTNLYRMIKVHTIGGKVYEGHVFAIDPVTKAIILSNEETFRMISHSQIDRIEGDISAIPVPDVTEFGIRVTSLEKKEQVAHDNAEKSISALNFDVSPNIQTLYDRLSFMYVLINRYYPYFDVALAFQRYLRLSNIDQLHDYFY